MTFVLICIGALVLLGGVAALLSRGDDTPIQQGHDCSETTAPAKSNVCWTT